MWEMYWAKQQMKAALCWIDIPIPREDANCSVGGKPLVVARLGQARGPALTRNLASSNAKSLSVLPN